MNAIQSSPDIDIRDLVSGETLTAEDRAALYRESAAEQRGLPKDATWGDITEHDLKGSGLDDVIQYMREKLIIVG